MIPWEREIYINVLVAYEEKKQQQQIQVNNSKDFNFYG